MQEVGDEETMLICLLTLKTDTRPALTEPVDVVVVDTETDYAVLVDLEKALGLGTGPILISTHARQNMNIERRISDGKSHAT